MCRCGAAFTRRDLLTRHWRLTHHASNPEVTNSTLSEETATIDRPPPQQLSHVLDIAPNGVDATGVTGVNGHILSPAQADELNVHAPGVPFLDAQTHLLAPGMLSALPKFAQKRPTRI